MGYLDEMLSRPWRRRSPTPHDIPAFPGHSRTLLSPLLPLRPSLPLPAHFLSAPPRNLQISPSLLHPWGEPGRGSPVGADSVRVSVCPCHFAGGALLAKPVLPELWARGMLFVGCGWVSGSRSPRKPEVPPMPSEGLQMNDARGKRGWQEGRGVREREGERGEEEGGRCLESEGLARRVLTPRSTASQTRLQSPGAKPTAPAAGQGRPGSRGDQSPPWSQCGVAGEEPALPRGEGTRHSREGGEVPGGGRKAAAGGGGGKAAGRPVSPSQPSSPSRTTTGRREGRRVPGVRGGGGPSYVGETSALPSAGKGRS